MKGWEKFRNTIRILPTVRIFIGHLELKAFHPANRLINFLNKLSMYYLSSISVGPMERFLMLSAVTRVGFNVKPIRAEFDHDVSGTGELA